MIGVGLALGAMASKNARWEGVQQVSLGLMGMHAHTIMFWYPGWARPLFARPASSKAESPWVPPWLWWLTILSTDSFVKKRYTHIYEYIYIYILMCARECAFSFQMEQIVMMRNAIVPWPSPLTVSSNSFLKYLPWTKCLEVTPSWIFFS